MNDILVLPGGPLARASLELARSSENQPIFDHSIRSFLFARLLAEREGSLMPYPNESGKRYSPLTQGRYGTAPSATRSWPTRCGLRLLRLLVRLGLNSCASTGKRNASRGNKKE